MTFTITPSDALYAPLAVKWLQSLGYIVHAPDAALWESVAAFRARLGISSPHFSRRTRHPRCPGFQADRGKRRISHLVSNPELEAFLLAHLPKPEFENNKPHR